MTPTFTTRSDIRIVGLAQPFRRGGELDGPSVWRRFRPFIERIPNRVGTHTFGLNEVVDMAAGELVYAPAIEVSEFVELSDGPAGPDKLFGKTLEGGRFAIFAVPLSSGDVGAEFRSAYDFIYGAWAQRDDVRLRAYYDFEYYDARFDPETLSGEASIWVPVA